MKFLPLPDFDAVNGALNFNTPDSHVTGGCDIYTTKSTGTDKKLYKSIDKDINTQHAAFLQLGASLSPPNRAAMLASSPGMELFSHSSPFGPLSELSSRRTFAYLIATLNASHPHYDFSHVLRPGDFKRERNLRRVMGNLDSILQNVRPSADSARSGESGLTDASGGAVWGPHCWAKIDNEMHLNDCTVFSYNPEVDPFEEDERAIYAVHYFFFSRSLKRVAYLHLRVVPVVSANSPDLVVSSSPSGTKRKRRRHRGTLGSIDLSSKRARYWLGDRDGELVASYDDDEDEGDDGLTWNRDEDGEIVNPEYDDYDENDYEDGFDEDEDEEDEEDDDYESQEGKSPVRGMSEDVVASMEI